MSFASSASPVTTLKSPSPIETILHPIRHWLDSIQVCDSKFAKSVCKLIPSQCPFERDVQLFGHTLFHIPPMCKLNPLYNELIGLRFRALTFLADVCHEDITPYCC